MAASIKRFDSTGGKMLYLETHGNLTTAMGLRDSFMRLRQRPQNGPVKTLL